MIAAPRWLGPWCGRRGGEEREMRGKWILRENRLAVLTWSSNEYQIYPTAVNNCNLAQHMQSNCFQEFDHRCAGCGAWEEGSTQSELPPGATFPAATRRSRAQTAEAWRGWHEDWRLGLGFVGRHRGGTWEHLALPAWGKDCSSSWSHLFSLVSSLLQVLPIMLRMCPSRLSPVQGTGFTFFMMFPQVPGASP